MQTARDIYARYQEIRHRLPMAPSGGDRRAIDSLLDIAEEVDAFVFDAFGVLNVGETAIEGAAARLDELRARGCLIRVLTNAASHDRAGAIAKFRRLGMRLEDDEIITSRDATLGHLPPGRLGAIAADADTLHDLRPGTVRLGKAPGGFDAVDGIVFLSTADWAGAQQDMLEASLHRTPRPVLIANADLAAPRDDGFSREPGYFGHRIADVMAADTPPAPDPIRGLRERSALPGQAPDRVRGRIIPASRAQVRFFGKPFPEIYALAEATLPGIAPDRIAMCGDALHTDILGAAAQGWRSVLVMRDGLFRGLDVGGFIEDSGIVPDWTLDRI